MKTGKIKLILITLALLVFLVPVLVKAVDITRYGVNDQFIVSADLPVRSSIWPIVSNVIATALSMVAVIFFAFMIYGGFRWMVARGNEEDTKKALSVITAAIIGLIIVLASYLITSFALGIVNSDPKSQELPPGTVTLSGACVQDRDCKDSGATCVQMTNNLKGCSIVCINNDKCQGTSYPYCDTNNPAFSGQYTCTSSKQ